MGPYVLRALDLEAVLACIPDAALAVRADGTIACANTQVRDLLGYRPEELAGKPLAILIPESLRERHEAHVEGFFASPTSRPMGSGLRFHAVRADRSEVPVDIALRYLVIDGLPVALASLRDRSATERRLHMYESAKKAAERAERAKQSFLAAVTHELRTPITIIQGYSELLETRLHGNTEALEDLKAVAGAASHLLELVNDILDITALEAGTLVLEPQPCSPLQIAENLRALFLETCTRRGLAFELHAPPDLPQAVRADPERLRQILVNLAGNAVKFTEKGGIEIRLRRAQTPGGTPAVAFEVRDTGIGIPPESLERIFEPFRQLDLSLSREYGETGLGLAISRRLAELHGGSLTVESDANGSTFTLVLPVAGPGREMPAEDGGAEAETGADLRCETGAARRHAAQR